MSYVSCEWAEFGLSFWPTMLKHCCISHHGNRGMIPICEYHGGELPLDKIMEARKKVKGGGHPKCRDCVFLKHGDWKPEYLFTILNLSHFTFCNLRCDYCYLTKDLDRGGNMINEREAYDLTPVIESMIVKRQLAPWAEVHWGGGEPTILKNFDKMIDMLAPYGTRMQLNTNAVVYHDAVERNLRHRNFSIVTSIDAGTRENYHKYKRKDFFDRVFDNLGRYARFSPNVGAKYIVTHDNCKEEDAVGFAANMREHGVRRAILDIDSYIHPAQQKHFDMVARLQRELAQAGVPEVMVAGPGMNSRTDSPVSKERKVLVSLL